MSTSPPSSVLRHSPTTTTDDDGWQSTRAETTVTTEIQPREEDLGDPQTDDIGRQTTRGQHELFVSCDPGEALQQQFEHLRPEYIALHDVATAHTRRLVAGLAAALGRPVQKLVIRRQGYGTPLATLEFIDFIHAGRSLRIYTTDCETDTHTRHELARVLLSYARLGVLMVGDIAPHQMASNFESLHETMIKNSWRNRHMLVLPMATSSALSNCGVDLARGTGVSLRTTPQITKAADAWSFISSTWNKLREQVQAQGGIHLPALPGANGGTAASTSAAPVAASAPAASLVPPAPTTPVAPAMSSPFARTQPGKLTMTPMPTVGNADSAQDDSALGRYVNQLVALTGMVSVGIFDIATGEGLMHAGARPGIQELGQHGAALLAAMTQTSRTLGMGHVMPEAAITLGTHHLLLRAIPFHPGLALHAVLDKSHGNLTLARLQIQRMDSLLAPG